MQVNQPCFLDIVISPTSPNLELVKELLVPSLSKIGLVNKFEKFRLLLTDGAAYNVAVENVLKNIYTKMIHTSCVHSRDCKNIFKNS